MKGFHPSMKAIVILEIVFIKNLYCQLQTYYCNEEKYLKSSTVARCFVSQFRKQLRIYFDIMLSYCSRDQILKRQTIKGVEFFLGGSQVRFLITSGISHQNCHFFMKNNRYFIIYIFSYKKTKDFREFLARKVIFGQTLDVDNSLKGYNHWAENFEG